MTTALIGVSTYAVVCFLMVAIWYAHPVYLEFGRDARLANWLIRESVTWSSPLSVTTINPFQGAGSMMMPVNGWWIPGAWPIDSASAGISQYVISGAMYFSELYFATLTLGLVLGIAPSAALPGALFCILLLFSPFNFRFGLQGWIGTAPHYAHTLSLVCLLYVSLLTLRWNAAIRRPANIARASVIFIFVLLILYAILLASPFWNAGLLIGAGIGLATIGLGSPDRATFICRGTIGVAVIGWAKLSGVLEFLQGAQGISARFETARAHTLAWPDWSSLSRMPAASSMLSGLCSMGVGCGSPSIIWVHMPILLGCAATAMLSSDARLRRAATVTGIVWIALLWYWIALLVGFMRATDFAPVYFFLPLYPLLALMAAAGAVEFLGWLRRFVRSRFGLKVPMTPVLATALAGAFSVGVMARYADIAGALGASVSIARADFATLERHAAEFELEPNVPPALSYVRERLALKPDAPFRGSFVSALGVPGGELRQTIEAQGGAGGQAWEFEEYHGLVRRGLGNAMFLTDVWDFDIPTLEEYGQAVTLGLKLYERAFLLPETKTVDAAVHHFVLVRNLDVPILESLGVRFVLTDAMMSDDVASVKMKVPLRSDINLRLYELRNPNLGTYSPSEFRRVTSASEIVSALKQDSRRIRKVAMIEEPPDVELEPPLSSTFNYVRNGVVLTAASRGVSAVLLPLQFSHCLVPTVAGPGHLIALMRANLLHTLVIFSGDVTLRLDWRYSFFGDARCRTEDVADMERLGVHEALLATSIAGPPRGGRTLGK